MKRRGRSFHDVLLGLVGSRFDLLDLFQRCFLANVSLRDGRQRLALSVLGLLRILLFSLHKKIFLRRCQDLLLMGSSTHSAFLELFFLRFFCANFLLNF